MNKKFILTIGSLACAVGSVVCEALKAVIEHRETVSEVTKEVLSKLEKK